MPLPGPKTTFTIKRRTEGDRNPSGEAAETWDAVTGESNIKAHYQPLALSEQTALKEANPGQTFTGGHLFFFEKGTDIVADDRIYDSVTGNYFVAQVIEEWPTGHIEVIAGITNRQ